MPTDRRIFVNPNGGARKGGMDKDTEERYVANGFYIDARNVNFMANGDKFVISNMKGNTQKTYSLNSGSNICIGAFDDKGNETVYAFIWNGAGDHEILKYEYNISVDAVSKVVEGAGLAFEVDKLITGITVVNDRFLVWGQEGQEIGCVDLENPPAISLPVSDRWRIELAKAEDPEPLQCFYLENSEVNQTAISNFSFQFRYRYVYEGNFRSPFSTISTVPVPDNIFLLGNTNYKSTYDNSISILLPTPSFNKVEKIELFVRYETSDDTKEAQNWYKFKEVEYNSFSAFQSELDIVFTGSEALIPQDPAETITEATFYPKSAKEVVSLPSNVLAFLNFKDGVDSSAVEPEVRLIPQYKARPTSKGSTSTTATYSSTNTTDVRSLVNVNYDIDLTTTAYETITIGGTPQVGDTVQITLALYYEEESGLTNPAGISATPATTTKSININYVVKEEDDTTTKIASKVRQVINSIDTTYDGFGGIVAYNSNNVIRIYEGEADNSPYEVLTTINSGSTTASTTVNYPASLPNVQFKIRRTKKTLKRNASHPYAIQYRDRKGRRSAAIPLGELYVKGQDETTNDDWVELKLTINHLAPEWATDYDILYAKNKTYRRFLQVACNADEIETNLWRARVYDNLAEFYNQYGDANNTLDSYNYNYVEGDRIRLLGVISSIGILNKFSEQKDYPISREDSRGVYFSVDSSSLTPSFDNGAVGPIGGSGVDFSGNNIVRSTGNWVSDGYAIGQRVLIENASASANNLETRIVNITNTSSTNDTLVVSADLTTSSADTSATFTRTEKLLVEVYTPAQQNDGVYYEIAAQGTVNSSRYHVGNSQTQNASQPAIIDLKNTGDAYQVYIPFVVDQAFVNTNAFIECMDMSPVKNSSVTDIGRGNVDDEFTTEITRESAITFTQPIIDNSPTNGLSIVLGTSLYNEFGSDFGSIQKAFLRQDRNLVIFFEDKVGYMGVFSELRKSANGDVSYATDSLTNQINFYAYDGGIGMNPESFAYYDTTCYFLSRRNNAFCRLANDGITEISRYGMTSWSNDNLDVKSNNVQGLRAVGVYDERNQSYILALRNYFSLSYLSGSTIEGLTQEVVVTPDLEGSYGASLIGVGDTLVITNTALTPVTETVTITSSSFDSGTGQFTLRFDSASILGSEVFTMFLQSNIETLMFSEEANGWSSFLDFNPDFMTTCGVDYVTWNNGNTWLHNDNDTRGSFYGVNNEATITIPFNATPEAIKIFNNIQLDSNVAWDSDTSGDISTPEGQASQLASTDYTEFLPNRWSAALFKDENTPIISDPLFEGDDLRSYVLKVKLKTDSTGQVKLASAAISFTPNNLTI